MDKSIYIKCIRTHSTQPLPDHSGCYECAVCNPTFKIAGMPKTNKGHFHHCPEYYYHYPCDLYCTVEPDLRDNCKDFGVHCLCDDCKNKKDVEDKYLSKEFWDRYNGFIKIIHIMLI